MQAQPHPSQFPSLRESGLWVNDKDCLVVVQFERNHPSGAEALVEFEAIGTSKLVPFQNNFELSLY